MEIIYPWLKYHWKNHFGTIKKQFHSLHLIYLNTSRTFGRTVDLERSHLQRCGSLHWWRPFRHLCYSRGSWTRTRTARSLYRSESTRRMPLCARVVLLRTCEADVRLRTQYILLVQPIKYARFIIAGSGDIGARAIERLIRFLSLSFSLFSFCLSLPIFCCK